MSRTFLGCAVKIIINEPLHTIDNSVLAAQIKNGIYDVCFFTDSVMVLSNQLSVLYFEPCSAVDCC